MATPKVELYGTRTCPYCTMARRLFDSKGVPYEDIDVTGDHAKRQWLLEQSGQHTVPQVFIAGQSYGGFTDIAALDRRGELDRLLGLAT